jgi:hypothetical protein
MCLRIRVTQIHVSLGVNIYIYCFVYVLILKAEFQNSVPRYSSVICYLNKRTGFVSDAFELRKMNGLRGERQEDSNESR